MTLHAMDVDVKQDLGKVVYSCPICQRCVEVDDAGGIRILHRGDRSARHQAGLLAGSDTELDQARDSSRRMIQ